MKEINKKIKLNAGFNLTSVPEEVSEYVGKDIEVNKALGYGEVEVVVSNSATDRHGESITMEGIDLSQIRKNPVVLWGHQYDQLPIGRIIKLWKSAGNLMARIKLDYDIYDFAKTVYEMILRGTLNAVSIGGYVKEFAKSNGETDYNTIAKMEMIELSVVPVGAHPDALVTSKGVELNEEDVAKQYAEFQEKVILKRFENLPKDKTEEYKNTLKQVIKLLDTSENSKESVETEEEQEVIKKKIIYTI